MNTAANIMGIGVDIVSVARMRKVLERHPLRFPRRVLHPQEHEDYRGQRDPLRFLARRFAAKEAVAKALGLGFTSGAYARRIRIEHDALGRPTAVVDLPPPHLPRTALLSIADEKDYAVAQAVVIQEPADSPN